MYVQYGSGRDAPPTWRNFDNSPAVRLKHMPAVGTILGRQSRLKRWPDNVEYGNIVEGLPIPLGRCEAIYCSHVIEHIPREHLQRALRHTHDYLKHGGLFRLVTPDFRRMAEQYARRLDADALHIFMRRSGLSKPSVQSGWKQKMRAWFRHASHQHLWDFEALQSELVRAGFVGVRRAQYGDSEEAAFNAVERESRWHGTLGIECKKVG